ncbi:phage head-tail adapter protein [Brevundimonas sp.]|uniref:phage head-tail adapter protein n=1 Tax=Brevundimonas sp. TaxID=1871086 RepID=UPI003AF67DD9
MNAAARRVLAALYAVTVAETPYGGQARTYELLGQIWLNPGKVGARRRSGPDGQKRIETRRATAGPDPRLNSGRVLAVEGVRWRILAVSAGPAETELELERLT